MILPFEFKGKTSDGLYHGIANTPALDRDGEVLLPKGCDTRNFMSNPVMLMIHNYRAVPVGKVESLNITPEFIEFDFKFAENPIGKELEDLYNHGFMSAFSVGFIPHKWTNPALDGEKSTNLEVETFEGTKYAIDLTKYAKVPQKIYTHWELLEISPVPVPSNPEALIRRNVETMIGKSMGSNMVLKAFAEDSLNSDLVQIANLLQDIETKCKDFEVSGVVPKHSCEVSYKAWDSTTARVELAKWASSDGTGNKETISWAKWAKGFCWMDVKNLNSFGSYKFPHHVIEGGELKTSADGVFIAMANLLGANGETDLTSEDKKEVYNHLSQHYSDMSKTAPEFKNDYSQEEYQRITIGDTLMNKDEVKHEEVVNTPPPSILPVLEDLRVDLGIRLSMINDNIELLVERVQRLEAIKDAPIVEKETEQTSSNLCEVEELLKSFIN